MLKPDLIVVVSNRNGPGRTQQRPIQFTDRQIGVLYALEAAHEKAFSEYLHGDGARDEAFMETFTEEFDGESYLFNLHRDRLIASGKLEARDGSA